MREFSYHRKSGTTALLSIAILAVVVETVPVHFLVRRWSATAAWVLTTLSAAGIVSLVRFIHAVRSRPVLVSDDTVLIRCGPKWTVAVPRDAIRHIDVGHISLPTYPTKTPGLLRATLATQPNVLLTLDRPVTASGMYGMSRQVTSIAFTVDDRDAFRAALA